MEEFGDDRNLGLILGESIIPVNETLIGLRVVGDPHGLIFGLATITIPTI